MTSTLRSAIPTIAMIAALTMAPVAPEASNVLFLSASAAGLLLIWPRAIGQLRRPIVWMPLAGFVLVGLAYGVTAGLAGLNGLLYFAPLLCILPLVTLSREIEPEPFAVLIGLLALCGVVGATVMAIIEVQVTGTLRAGLSIANPIHFADVVLLAGLMALFGITGSSGWLRALMLLIPLGAIVPVGLSGTRGAVIAAAASFVAFVVTALLLRLLPRKTVVIGAIGLACLVVLGLALGVTQLSAVQRVLSDIGATLSHGVPTDESTSLRLQMYIGGLRAFLDAPLFGHGPLEFTNVADRLADVTFGGAPHLHNDLLDMAASAGVVGLAAYVLIVLAPLVEVLRAPSSVRKLWTVVVVVTLTTGFVVMGLTNAMFGILTVTVSFAAICVLTGLLTHPSTGQDPQARSAHSTR